MDLKNKRIKIIDGQIPPKYTRAIKQATKINSHLIHGRTAYQGVVQGKIQTIKSLSDIRKFKSGHILLANTTHPNYLPAMQKSSAIVTNEGGIISHAAIVARELKIPCVTGTKIATKVLKDGDLVEVNADQGIVRKL